MASRAPEHRKKGNTCMDAALDAMYQLGFEKQLVQKTVKELLDVFDGTQPFIEESSYKLLIATLLSKQQDSAQDKDSAKRDGINETTSVGISVNETTLHTGGDLDSSSQANDHNDVSLENLETDVRDSEVSADRGGHEQDMNQSENELKPVDNVKESNVEIKYL